jgi:DNA-binding transcriptional MerR regulator
MDSSPGPVWTAGQVARDLGISDSTLRTWHRRYGLSPQDAQPGRYRRYGPEDVARLRRMQELIALGMLASDAARLVRGGEPPSPPPARDVADLVEAARALDGARCDLLLDRLLARRGVADAWELVCCPALVAVDAHPALDPVLLAVEHTLSWSVLGALHRYPRPPAVPGAAPVLLACAQDELHTLPLAALAAALAEHRVPSRMLGASTPGPSLERAVQEARPDAVVVWAQRRATADPGLLRALSRYPVRLVAAGPGWDIGSEPGLPPVPTLRAALAFLAGPPGDGGR